MKICDKCFKDTDKEYHSNWCPNNPSTLNTMDMPEGFDEIFKGFDYEKPPVDNFTE
ncbi:MAG: hypothetical protein ABIK92_04605 [Pseudomonadota bacterium]